jgi:hypothetical protein
MREWASQMGVQMYVRRYVLISCGMAILSITPGCASVMSGRHADVTVYSNVPNARVAIRDKHGKQVASTDAGSTVVLKRKDKWVFPAKYTATVEAPGYQTAEVPISSTVNPWVLGNVAFLQLGLVGLAVDNATGAAWMPTDSTYYQELTPIGPAYGAAYGPAFSAAPPPASPTYTAALPAPPIGTPSVGYAPPPTATY